MNKSQKIKKEVADRLNKLISEAGFRTNREFASAMTAAYFSFLSSVFIELFSVSTSPKTDNWIGIKNVLEEKLERPVSLDWLIAGEEPKPDDTELKKVLKYLDNMRGEAYNLSDPRLKEYAERFAALPKGLRETAEQLLKAMEDAAKQKDTD